MYLNLLYQIRSFLANSQCIAVPRSNPPEVFLEKAVLKICSKFTREHPYQSVISIKFRCNFIELKLRDLHSPVNLLHISGKPFDKNTCGGLLLSSVNLIPRKWNWIRLIRTCLKAITCKFQICH